jgi:hypothetical protein
MLRLVFPPLACETRIVDVHVTWGGEPEDLSVKTVGDAAVDELHAWVEGVVADPRFRENMKVLLDHTNTRWWALSNDEVRQRAGLLVAESEKIGLQRIAFVVGTPVDYGIGRMLNAQIAGRVSFVSEIFQSLQAGREWLRVVA